MIAWFTTPTWLLLIDVHPHFNLRVPDPLYFDSSMENCLFHRWFTIPLSLSLHRHLRRSAVKMIYYTTRWFPIAIHQLPEDRPFCEALQARNQLHVRLGREQVLREFLFWASPLAFLAGWWLTYPSEKYESQIGSWWIIIPTIGEIK